MIRQKIRVIRSSIRVKINICQSNSGWNILMHLCCQLFHLTAFDSDLYLDRSSFRLFFSFFMTFICNLLWKLTTDQHFFFCTESYSSTGLIFKYAKELYPGKQEEELPIKIHTDCFQYSSWFGNCQIF